MSNSNLKILLKEYEQNRLQAELDLENKLNNFYIKNPDVSNINDKINRISIEISKTILLNKNSEKIDKLNIELEKLKKEKQELLNKLNVKEDFFVPKYSCKLCNDTGYFVDNNQIMCTCLKQKLLNIQYNKSNISSLENENFNNFNINIFSDEKDEKKYNSNISPKENIEKIKEIALDFIQNFDDPQEKNLLFTGNTGLGKTYLTNCIANELLKQGKTVLYQTAPVMLDSILDYRFGKNNEFNYNDLLNVDLLIIDDLGSEQQTSFATSALFDIINTRTLNGKKIIINTNLEAK
ncbi:MAG: ATP-binding protein, partial [Mycoplasmataceae bacterium]|nr:ATP-binding protein [Mycoplasmataceae bacterium]